MTSNFSRFTRTLVVAVLIALVGTVAFAQNRFSVGVDMVEPVELALSAEVAFAVVGDLDVSLLATVPLEGLSTLEGVELLGGLVYRVTALDFTVQENASFTPFVAVRVGGGDLFTGGDAYWVGTLTTGVIGFDLDGLTLTLEAGGRFTTTDTSFADFRFAPTARVSFGVPF